MAARGAAFEHYEVMADADADVHPDDLSEPDEHQPLLERERYLQTRHDVGSNNSSSSDHGQHVDQVSYSPGKRNPFEGTPVYENIWRIRTLVVSTIHDPYSLEQFQAPRLNIYVVRPLTKKLYESRDMSTIFCLLVNRAQFLGEQATQAHEQSVKFARATLCEILAVRLMREFNDDCHGAHHLLMLSHMVIGGFDPFQQAPEEVLSADQKQRRGSRRANAKKKDEDDRRDKITTLEVAILSKSKLFLASAGCQKVVHAVYTGRVVYSPSCFFEILPDRYHRRPISIYNPRRASVLNQYRLSVPRIRNAIEVLHFTILLVLYVLVMTAKDPERVKGREILFCAYTFGWILDQLASMLEHGWTVYSQNLWSYLDVIFAAIFLVFFGLRVHACSTGNTHQSGVAFDFLAMASPFLIPRLGFNLFSNNIVFVALREMMSRFLLLIVLAIWTFTGFMLAMLWLGDGTIGATTISKWMIWVWFGLDGTGIGEAARFHALLGPILMVTFAVLGNTLFLTIVVSTLSHAFGRISRDSAAEVAFRKAVLTFEGVKSDTIFSYPLPLNVLALVVMPPLKLALSPRWFHKVNVTAIRCLNAPALLLINLYDRYTLSRTDRDAAPVLEYVKKLYRGESSRFRFHGDIKAVFEHEPPPGSRRDPGARKDPDTRDGPRSRPMNGQPPKGNNPDKADTSRNGEASEPKQAVSSKQSPGPSTSIGHLYAREARELDAPSRTDARLQRMEELLARICDAMEDAQADEPGSTHSRDDGDEGDAVRPADDGEDDDESITDIELPRERY